MAYPFQQMQNVQAAKAEPDLPGSSAPYAQPYAQVAQVYPQPEIQQGHIRCAICTVLFTGTYFRCVGCKNNGRPGGFLLCPTCHSRQKVKSKGILAGLNEELGSIPSKRPHERWHHYERIDPILVAQPVMQAGPLYYGQAPPPYAQPPPQYAQVPPPAYQ